MDNQDNQLMSVFLTNCALFPFPESVDKKSINATEISIAETGKVDVQWKAEKAIRDDNMATNLCDVLDNILDNIIRKRLSPAQEARLRFLFAPEIDRDGANANWQSNPDEPNASSLFDRGVYRAAEECLAVIGKELSATLQSRAEGYNSKVDYVFKIKSSEQALVDIKNDQIMKCVGKSLPLRGYHLVWKEGHVLWQKVILKACLHMAEWKIRWFFLTSHNHWIILRLHDDSEHPYVTYSPMLSIQNDTTPFRAFLGALLAAEMNQPVPENIDTDVVLDDIHEDPSDPPTTQSQTRTTGRTLALTMTPSETQNALWIYLRQLDSPSMATLVDGTDQPMFLWLTRQLGRGSTAIVYEGQLDPDCARKDVTPRKFAVKYVEVLRHDDEGARDRLRREFDMYQILERAHGQFYQPTRRIAPRCYGMFENKTTSVLLLELQGDTLSEWGELDESEKEQIFELAQELHKLGIAHWDLEPRNIVRTVDGGFCIIDFTESRVHKCRMAENATKFPTGPVKQWDCEELRWLRKEMWKRVPFDPKTTNPV